MALSLIYRQPTILGFRSCLAFETSLRKSPSDLPPVASLTCIGELTFGYVLRSAGLKSCHSPMCAMRHITPLTGCSCREKLKPDSCSRTAKAAYWVTAVHSIPWKQEALSSLCENYFSN